jgi:shikimate kinase
MNVVLIGYRGCGKSTVGQALAERLGWPFVDTDTLIQQRTGMTIREIFTDRAEEGFRDVEAKVIAEVARLGHHVISTGGGAVLRAENVEALRDSGKLVYLTAPPEILWKRIFDDVHRHETRLQMSPDTGLQQVRQAFMDRDPIYTGASDCIVSTADRSIEDIVRRILTRTGLSRS